MVDILLESSAQVVIGMLLLLGIYAVNSKVQGLKQKYPRLLRILGLCILVALLCFASYTYPGLPSRSNEKSAATETSNEWWKSYDAVLLLGNESNVAAFAHGACIGPAREHLIANRPGYELLPKRTNWDVFSIGENSFHCRGHATGGYPGERPDTISVHCEVRRGEDGSFEVVNVVTTAVTSEEDADWNLVRDYYQKEHPELIVN